MQLQLQLDPHTLLISQNLLLTVHVLQLLYIIFSICQNFQLMSKRAGLMSVY